MAIVPSSLALSMSIPSLVLPSTSYTNSSSLLNTHVGCRFPLALSSTIMRIRRKRYILSSFAMKSETCAAVDEIMDKEEEEMGRNFNETVLYSFTPLPLFFVAALPGGTVALTFLFYFFFNCIYGFDFCLVI